MKSVNPNFVPERLVAILRSLKRLMGKDSTKLGTVIQMILKPFADG